MVLGQGARLAGLGIGAGLVAAGAATRLLRGLLYGVSPVDPATFVAMPVLLLAVSLLGSLLPALRAAKVDPGGSAALRMRGTPSLGRVTGVTNPGLPDASLAAEGRRLKMARVLSYDHGPAVRAEPPGPGQR